MRIRVIVALLALLVASIAQTAPSAAAGGPSAYLVATTRPLTAAQIADLKAAGATVKYAYRTFGGAAVVATERDLTRIRALRFVTAVNPDTVKELDAVYVSAPSVNTSATALPGGAIPYWQDLIDAENDSHDGTGVLVFGLDAGFYPNWRDYFDPGSIRDDLATAFIAALGNPNQNQWDIGSDPHGMATAATVVGYYLRDKPGEGAFGSGYATGAAGTYWVPGVASGAQFVPIKVCEPIGCFGSAINAGMDYVTSYKLANPSTPVVINESLGGAQLDPTEKAAIDAAVAAGVIIVASAGNSGNLGMGYPAAYEPVISVGAGGWRAQWHNWPVNTWWLENVDEDGVDEVFVVNFSSRQLTGQHLDIVSTGRNMLLPYPCARLYKDGQVTSGTLNRTCAAKATPDSASSAPFQYLYISGTSFSSPTIAGVVARMLQKNSTLSSTSVEAILEGTAVDIAPNALSIRQRNGSSATECWEVLVTGNASCQELEATGHGWVFVDLALAATP